MSDVNVCRFVNRPATDVLDALQAHVAPQRGLGARIGPPHRLAPDMATLPVSWRSDGILVFDGHLRLLEAAPAPHPVTEVQLVGYRLTAGVDALELLDALLAEAEREAASH
jgi:hypothetical protein